MIDYTIFIVDDEKSIREGIALDLEDEYKVFAFATAEEALEYATTNQPPDLMLLDINLPGMSGIEALVKFKASFEEILIIMITAFEGVESVIQCMKQGAHDYVVKPIHMEGLEVTIANALETIRLRKEVRLLQEKQIREELPCFIGESHIIHDLMEYIAVISKSPDTPVLIQGETGTGKELIASTIHHRSPNFKGPFVTVNCAAIPKDLLESELFGYEKGAFSGASTTGKKGLIESAENGTLFLDEVGDLRADAQAKLLRFLEDGEFYKVGSTSRQRVKTRIVSATNKDLELMVSNETFRKDLYFRLGVIKIQVPSLGERQDDVVLLARYFLHIFNEKFDKKITTISDKAAELLKLYSWSGNVRELRNMMERAVLTATGETLSAADLGLEAVQRGRIMPETPSNSFAPLPPTGIDLEEVRAALEVHYYTQALKMAKGNETRAAKLLNIKHHTFRYRVKKLMG